MELGLKSNLMCWGIRTSFFVLSIFCASLFAQQKAPENISIPISQVSQGAEDYVPDGSLSLIRDKQQLRWMLPVWDRKNGGIVHLAFSGPLDAPFSTRNWGKPRGSFFRFSNGPNGNLWIVNTYLADEGILAFVHLENVDGTGGRGSPGRSRIGLAWSKDGGESYFYLGDILHAFGDPDPHNIQGAPYIIRDGSFLVYFHDVNGLSVARAPVDDVLIAAKQGRVTKWMKYTGRSDGFSADGLGGKSLPLGVQGISHGDAACRVTNEKCYLVLTRMNWGGERTWVRMYESSDGISWAVSRSLAEELIPEKSVRGYQYATIVDSSGNDNAKVGSEIFIYVMKNHLDADRTYHRWHVYLDPISEKFSPVFRHHLTTDE